jgi:H+/Cl- antiporter ClcA
MAISGSYYESLYNSIMPDWIRRLKSHRYGLTLFAFLTAAICTGAACVAFARAFEFVLLRRLDFTNVGAWCWLITPVVILGTVELIRRTAPYAAGTGIPQAIFASEHMDAAHEKTLFPLVSLRTMAVKIAAILLGIWVGASTGREGPTVHIAVCVFTAVLLIFRRLLGLDFDMRSASIAGGAAGLAAAFNTPLAGVTFAVEELSENYFSAVKDFVVMAIIVSAVAAKMLTGEYAYFGKLSDSTPVPLVVVLVIGLAGGAAGALFSSLLLRGSDWSRRASVGAGRYAWPVLMSLGLLFTATLAGMRVLGPGNRVAQILLVGQQGSWVAWFPLAKMASTLLTYWSGIAGGIFAPCLSIGAALGSTIGHWMQTSVATCALIGMAAFLSGSIQAPITSFVIIFEMTGHHQMLLPLMLASLLAFMVARLFGAEHLYKALARQYMSLLKENS